MTNPTYPTPKTFGALIIEVETATPGTYAALVGFDTKSSNLTTGTSTANLPSISNPDLPGWDITGVGSLKLQVQGSGVYAVEDEPMLEAWFDSAVPKNVRVHVSSVGYRQGPMVLTSLGNSVSRNQNGNLCQRSITLDSAGPMNFTAGDPS